MGGGVIQLIVYGSQDIYLTGEPQITFFKAVYKRYTNFAIESIPQNFLGSANFENTISVPIQRNGDLLKNIWLQYSPKNILSGMSGYTVAPNIGHTFIDTIDFLIGGQLVDRHYGKWLTIWNYLCTPNETGEQGPIDEFGAGPGEGQGLLEDSAYNEVITRPTRYNRMAYTHRAYNKLTDNSGAPNIAYIPMQFWFCRHTGLALPLIALQYHDVSMNITFSSYNNLTNAPVPTGMEFVNFTVYADYIYLDTTERRQFAQNANEYLIEQVQLNPGQVYPTVNLTFNHPVKELIWTLSPNLVVTEENPSGSASPAGSFTAGTPEQPNNYKLILNKTDRFLERDITYFTRNQVWDYHKGFGSVLWKDSIAVYSFALRPEEYQPSGTCNFSRLDTAQLVRTNPMNATVQELDVYAINYNILRIVSGMGGLAYSN
jgi:hypothetical protein